MADQLQTADDSRSSLTLDQANSDAVVGAVLRLQGPSRVLLVGSGMESLVVPLRSAGCAVSQLACGVSSGRAGVSPDPDTRARSAAADIAVVMQLDPVLPGSVLELDVATLLLLVPHTVASAEDPWRAATAAGWVLHTAYWALPEVVVGHSVLPFSRTGVCLDSPEAIVQANVFNLAAALVRPDDDVLLHAPIVTEAWRIVREQSRCAWLGVTGSMPGSKDVAMDTYASVPTLHGLEGRQVDFLVLANAPAGESATTLLLQAGRALRRSGRLLLERSSPDPTDWDEYGQLLESAGFTVDRAWLLRGGNAVNPMQRVQLDLTRSIAEQWVGDGVLVLMAVCIDGTTYPQVPDSDVPNIVAFQRDYIDASIVRLIVAMGYRIESVVQRRAIALEILGYAPAGSADQGAALCVLLYDDAAMQGQQGRRIQRLSQDYLTAKPINPTALRWQISIAFVTARRCQSAGDIEGAVRWYEHVLAEDVLGFSPLLGTKTTSAALALGWIAFALGDVQRARAAWRRGVEEARRLARDSDWREIVGDLACPETFGMPEFAAVIDEASSAATALRLTAESPLRRGLVWQWANRSWRQQITELQQELTRHRAWQVELQRGKDWLHAQYEVLTAEVARLSADRAEMHGQHEGALAASRLAHRAAEDSLQRQRGLYADLSAAYRLAHQRAQRQFNDQREMYGDLVATYRLAHADKQNLRIQFSEERDRLHLAYAERERYWEQEREDAAARLAAAVALLDANEAKYAGLLANYKLARRFAEQRIALLDDKYTGLVAAYRTARHDARREIAQLRSKLGVQRKVEEDLRRQLARLGDDHESHREVHARLVEAADGLGRACGRAVGRMNPQALQGEQLAQEMERIATLIDALPMKKLLRLAYQLWRRWSGRKRH